MLPRLGERSIFHRAFLTACRDRLLSPWGLVLGYVLATIVKAPSLFTAPRFWAEEGVLYFLQARAEGWGGALFAMPLGYLSLPANLAGLLAAELPLRYAPYGGLIVSFGIQMLLPWVVLSNRYFKDDRLRQGVLLLIPLMVFQSFETWLNSINSQFWLALTAACVLAAPSGSSSPRRHLANGFVLLMAGLSGPVASFLAPLFVLRGVLERKWAWCLYALPVAVGGILVVADQSAGERHLSFPLDVFAYASLFHVFLNNLCIRCAMALFPSIADHVDVFGVALALVGSGFAWAWWKGGQTARWLAAASLTLLVLSFVGMLGKEQFLHGAHHGVARYFFAPAALFYMGVLGARSSWKPGVMLLLGLLSINVIESRIRYSMIGQYDGKSWVLEVEAHEKGASDVIHFNPPLCGFAPDGPRQDLKPPSLLAASQTDLVFNLGTMKGPSRQSIYLYRSPTNDPTSWQRFDGEWHESGLFLYGLPKYGLCYGGDVASPVPGLAVVDGRVRLSRAEMGSLAGHTFLLGKGESFAAMLARHNYLMFAGDDLASQLPPAAPAQKRSMEKAEFSPAMVEGMALDYCARWAADCGQPAADAFCLAQGFDFAATFTIGHDAPPTRVISTGQTCESPGCNRIHSVVCSRRFVRDP